ncbi:type 4 prepilin-like proteins leader peptide-processing enzyme [Paraliobacillus ryukyuensis]|uniref:Type 4 prepilin peptidase 1 n=1 Tax=Paraliobacillus ryukyuensis TaxID=200904 RepID=A0A366EBS0_9BACI|nr:A24 family peptidase [Paraliobacillus ryukyuensis]RBO99495.1 type 4 prepilin peptidase 1 [Paraliobacillus ryukyuensis]
MELYMIIVFFVFGSVFGSFFNVVGMRIPNHTFFDSDRSYCPNCKKQLTWIELIPILSYVFQLGRCKGCKQKISVLYPIIELFTGVLFALSYARLGLQFELIIALLLSSMCAIILVSDIRYMIIPNKILLFFLPLFILLRAINPPHPWWSPLAGALIGFVVVFVIILVSKGGMGAGDMKLLAVLGIVLGYKGILLTFFLATLLGAIITLILLLLKKVQRKTPVPFGPFICMAACVTYFFGYDIITWYTTSFF